MATRYVHTNIVSADWRTLADFYTRVFDCALRPPERDQTGEWLDRGAGLEGARLRGVHLRLPGYADDGPTLEIFSYDKMQEAASPPAADRKGLGHLAFHVDEVEQICERVVMHGGSLLGEVSSAAIPSIGTLTFVYVLDPDGNIVEVQNWS